MKEAPVGSLQKVPTHLNELSETLLENVREGHDVKSLQKQLAALTLNELSSNLTTDAHRYSFWTNIYNAYIISILREHPEYYDDKDDFFTRAQIPIAGETISFDKIEHGILRKSQWKLGLGYFRKWFPDAFERQMRVQTRDYRIHFALNCGAKDCPPVAIYTPDKVDEQFDKGSEAYLSSTSKIESSSKKVAVTPLFSWFRGDFGGKSGTKEILKKHGLIKSNQAVKLDYLDYDWTLKIDNFVDL